MHIFEKSWVHYEFLSIKKIAPLLVPATALFFTSMGIATTRYKQKFSSFRVTLDDHVQDFAPELYIYSATYNHIIAEARRESRTMLIFFFACFMYTVTSIYTLHVIFCISKYAMGASTVLNPMRVC